MNPPAIPLGFWQELSQDVDYPLACVHKAGKFVWVNNAFERMLGYSSIELSTRTWMSISAHDDVGGDLASIEAVIAGKIQSYTMDKDCIHKRGFEVPVELTIRRFPSSVVEDLAYFRVEAAPAKATRPELQQMEASLKKVIHELQFRIEKQEQGVRVHVGDDVGGDKTGRDKVANSDLTIRYLAGALVFIALIVAWLFYYVATVHLHTPPEPPKVTVPVP